MNLSATEVIKSTIKELREQYERWAIPTSLQLRMWQLEDIYQQLTGQNWRV